MTNPIRIIGIDPGLRKTGWGIIETKGSLLTFIACGSVDPEVKLCLSDRLAALYTGLSDIIHQYTPHEAAVEETFMNKDPRSALKLGSARGIALVVPALAGLKVGEYSANQIKKTVVGAGHADKAQVQMMVKTLLPKSDFKSADAADALAIAITHAQYRTLRTLEGRMS